MKEVAFDRTAKNKPKHGCGHESDQNIEQQARGRVALGLPRGVGPVERKAESFPVMPHHRHHRSGLDRHLKELCLLPMKADQACRQNKVPGG